MDKALQDEALQTIQEEIRTRVFEKYAQLQGVQTQEQELKATLEALHEITHIPLTDIEKIASEVVQKHQRSVTVKTVAEETVNDLVPPENFTFEKLRKDVQKKRRGFMPHLIAYVCVNIPLIFLNIISTSFPWAMFPLLGWGIGLGSHYLASVRWPANELRDRIHLIKSQIHQILNENVPIYQTNAQAKIFNGIYRLIVTESSQEMMNSYLKSVDPQMIDHEVNQVTTQLCGIQNKYLKQEKLQFRRTMEKRNR